MKRVAAVRVVALAAAASFTSLAAGCDGASSARGRDAMLWIDDAQWRPGVMPMPSGGPEVVGVEALFQTVQIDTVGERYRGVLGEGARALVLGIDGDVGSWIVPASPPTAESPELPSFDLRVGFAAHTPPGPLTLRFVAVDELGRAGAAAELMVVAEEVPAPEGALVVVLGWQGAADLDLHVVDPDGNEAWYGDPNTYEPPPPGTPADPDAWRAGGLYTGDVNANCDPHGAPREAVVWTAPPPAGQYVVRVDLKASCGRASEPWYVAVLRDGEVIGAARGVAVADDARGAHRAGAGLEALRVTVP